MGVGITPRQAPRRVHAGWFVAGLALGAVVALTLPSRQDVLERVDPELEAIVAPAVHLPSLLFVELEDAKTRCHAAEVTLQDARADVATAEAVLLGIQTMLEGDAAPGRPDDKADGMPHE